MENRAKKLSTRKTLIICISIILTIILLLSLLFAGAGICSFAFIKSHLCYVNGLSMEPTLSNNDLVFIHGRILPYEPEQGDIVVIQGDFEGELYDNYIVKRVIATEGQTVRIEFFDDFSLVTVDGVIYKTPNEAYLQSYNYEDSFYYYEESVLKDNPHYNEETRIFEITVEDGCVFAMGDNRYRSADSTHKSIGCIPKDYILGKVVFRLLPLNKLGSLYD